MDDARLIINFMMFSERLKKEMRHSWLSDGRRESVAEHTWQMALLAILSYQYLKNSVDIEKSLKMIIVHDLIEAEAGDIPFFEKSERQAKKQEMELAAIKKIRNMLPEPIGEEVHDLWLEFEELSSPDARFVKALDNLEVQLQHNFAELDTWEDIEHELVYTKIDKYCSHDDFLKQLCELVKSDAESKMKAGGVDVEAIKRRATSLAS